MLEIVWGTGAWHAWRQELPEQARAGNPAQIHLLATRPQLTYTQEQLLLARPVWWGEPAHLVQGLAQAILDDSGWISPPEVDPQDVLERFGLAEAFLREMNPNGPADLAVSRSLAALILECKRAGLTGRNAVPIRGGSNWNKFQPLFCEYERLLAEYRLMDREDRIRLAVECLQQRRSRWISQTKELWISGFGDFTPLQKMLIEALLRQIPHCRVYLYLDDAKPEISRQRRETLDWLLSLKDVQIQERYVSRPESPQARFWIQRATRPQDEVRGLLEWLKDCGRECVMAEGDLVILARTPDVYAEWLARAVQAQGWQVKVQVNRALYQSAPVAALLHLVELAALDVNHERLLNVLCHPWFADGRLLPRLQDSERAEQMLNELSIAYRGWQDLFNRIEAKIAALRRDEGAGDSAEWEWQALLQDLRSLKEALGPWPEAASAGTWVEIVLGLSERFGLEEHPEIEDLQIPERQYGARSLQHLLQSLERWALLDSWTNQAPLIRSGSFRQRLHEMASGTMNIDVGPSESASMSQQLCTIQIMEPSQVRGLSFRYLAVLGLGEGSFPKIFRSDWLLPDSERLQLQKQIPLETTEDLRVRERLSFDDLLECGHERIFLSATGSEEEPWPAWVREIQSGRNVERAWEVPAPSVELRLPEIMTSDRRLLILRSLMVLAERSPMTDEAAEARDDRDRLVEWLESKLTPAEIRHMRLLQQMNRERESQRWGAWDGDLVEDTIRQALAQFFPEDYCYSVSQINEYARCPFAFFAHHVLGLQQDEETDDTPEVWEVGSMVHAALARFMSAHRGESLRPELYDQYERELSALLEQAWQEARRVVRTNTRAWRITGEAWRRRLRAWLRQTIERHVEQPDGFRPWLLEWFFGLRGRPPLALPPEETGLPHVLFIKGVIDRVDRADDGAVAIYDYKIGEGPNRKAMLEGWEFQIPLYMLAVRQLLEGPVIAGGGYYSLSYLHANNGLWDERYAEMAGVHRSAKAVVPGEDIQGMLDSAAKGAGSVITGLRNGVFHLRPRECPDYCAYADICRIGAHGKQIVGAGGETVVNQAD